MRLNPAFLFVLLCSGPLLAAEAGFQIESFTDASRDRPVMIDWWYPVTDQPAEDFNYGMGSGSVVEAGNIDAGTFPLIVLSHGALGAARNYSWIAEALARRGYIVAGISHYRESYVYGAEHIDPSAVLRYWERPLDVSAAISHITDQSPFARSVDSQRVGFLGHSSGGATALQLAGALLDGARMRSYCETHQTDDDRGCDYAKGVSSDNSQATPPAHHSYRDRRVRALVALDPALGPAVYAYAPEEPTPKMFIIASKNNDFLPFGAHAEAIAAHLPEAQTHWLKGNEGHFVYLNVCERDIAANGVPLCRDHETVSRNNTHQELQRQIIAFFDQHL